MTDQDTRTEACRLLAAVIGGELEDAAALALEDLHAAELMFAQRLEVVAQRVQTLAAAMVVLASEDRT